jgi:uncharacterized protein with PIN domain
MRELAGVREMRAGSAVISGKGERTPSNAERCPACGAKVRSLQIDETEERVLVSGQAIFVAIQIPGLEGHTTTHASRIHRCRRKPWKMPWRRKP